MGKFPVLGLPSPLALIPVTVQFTNTSQGLVTSWQWDFGDGVTSTEQNPTHEYSKTGSTRWNL